MSVHEAERRKRQREESKAALSSALINANLEHRAKAALAPDDPKRNRDREHIHGARAPPLAERLLNKGEVLTITGLSYPTIWSWMRAGRFPRSRVVGGKSMWLASEIDAWLTGLPVRLLKGDDAAEVARGGA